ncbi:hypothetical protein THO17_04400 [Marinomonas sp. THO17]
MSSSLAAASNVEQAQESAADMWDKTQQAAVEFADKASITANDLGDKIIHHGSIAGDKAADISSDVWQAMKQVGAETAEVARHGADNVRNLFQKEEAQCQQDSALCFKD